MASSSQEVIDVTDDEVFRRKLLMDGGGAGDDRRLTLLMREFFEWDNATDQTDEQIVSGYENLLSSLSNCELSMKKSKQAQDANELELLNYQQKETELEKNIVQVKETIVTKKGELKKAKKVRAEKQECDALARIVSQHPDRKETEAKLKALNEEIITLAKQKQALQSKFKKRHKKLDVLLSAAYELKEELKAAESASENNI